MSDDDILSGVILSLGQISWPVALLVTTALFDTILRQGCKYQEDEMSKDYHQEIIQGFKENICFPPCFQF